MNRQQRPSQHPRQGRQGQQSRSAVPSSNVPSTQQVVPGAAVSIVLKADQPTGREVQGTVKDLLTRGDHPRGIKVRLQDGRIGRVQRMATGLVTTNTTGPVMRDFKDQQSREADGDGADFPPLRSLADFLPPEPTDPLAASPQQRTGEGSETVKCPFCDEFEGDEVAVSHHLEEHLS